MEIRRVTVLGAGLMGNQIAMQAALSGYPVVCYDISKDMLARAAEYSGGWFAKRVEKGRLDAGTAAEAQGRLAFTDRIEEAADADIVLEAVSDLLAVKRRALRELDALTPKHCIYASNSSYIVSSRFADAVEDPSRVLNVHFFNPALVMKIVEVVRGPHVDPEVFETACRFVESIGKTPVRIEKEIYGFVVNRCFQALTREACYLVDREIYY